MFVFDFIEICSGNPCKSYTRRSYGCPWVGNCKMLHIGKSTKHFKFIASLLLTIRNMQCVCGTHFQPFNIRLKLVCSFGHSNHHLKSMHFSLKKTTTIFCVFRPTGIYGTIQYAICILICSLKQSQLPVLRKMLKSELILSR